MIGTDEGIYRYVRGKQDAERFTTDGGLADKAVGYIVEANNGDIWCSTSMGIWQYSGKWIGHVSGNGLTAKEYINCVGHHSDEDVVYFVNNDGLIVFRPAQVTGTHKELPPVQLTEFLIAGHRVGSLSDSFTISYLDNVVALEFSLLDFNNPDNILFEYRINGGKWVQNAEGQNSIQLSHLQPGTYQIEVRALSGGIYSASKTITVQVTPPWYRSSWAYFLYALVALVLLLLLGWILRKRAHRRLDEEKMRFLMNATHDIRSPLTLIMGPLKKLRNSEIERLKTVDEFHTFNSTVLQPSIDTIDRNAQKLMMLVNQILDERKIDKGQMQIHCQETNIVDLVSGICKLYQYEAQQRNIAFTFEHELNNVPLWVDRMNFDKVISNLLSNAFKYTCDNGEVKVEVKSEKGKVNSEERVSIRVIDSGIGFKEGESTKNLFERFHQGSNTVNLTTQGTGIGRRQHQGREQDRRSAWCLLHRLDADGQQTPEARADSGEQEPQRGAFDLDQCGQESQELSCDAGG